MNKVGITTTIVVRCYCKSEVEVFFSPEMAYSLKTKRFETLTKPVKHCEENVKKIDRGQLFNLYYVDIYKESCAQIEQHLFIYLFMLFVILYYSVSWNSEVVAVCNYLN